MRAWSVSQILYDQGRRDEGKRQSLQRVFPVQGEFKVAVSCCVSKLRGRLAGLSIEWQYFGFVFEEFVSVLHYRSCDAIEVLNFVGSQLVKNLLEAFNELVSCFSSKHVG